MEGHGRQFTAPLQRVELLSRKLRLLTLLGLLIRSTVSAQ
jgi:hypothetical protein